MHSIVQNAGLAETFSSSGPVEPRNIRETDQPFPEPALFLLNPDGEVVIIDYSNSPFARPDLRILVEGMPHMTSSVIHDLLDDMVRLSSLTTSTSPLRVPNAHLGERYGLFCMLLAVSGIWKEANRCTWL